MKTMPSIETQKRMHAFFVKTSAPRIVARELEEKRLSEAVITIENPTKTMADTFV